MTTRLSALVAALILTAGFGMTGCCKSSTSQASSESSSNSSSSCSPSGDKETAYERDVRDYTVAHAASGPDLDRFQRDLSGLARDYGISDWEGDRATHIAIGRGLASSSLDTIDVDVFATTLARTDPTRMGWVLGGYRIDRPE